MNIYSIEAGKFKLDGGAMFGVVPKTLWSKLNPPDSNNLCTWSMRCLLIEERDKLILIDTGMGDKQDEKFRSHFHPHGEDTLLSSIRKAGFSPDEITDVILTHLHFDHCGGAIYRDDKGNLLPQFPKAKYWSEKSHWEWALAPNARERASFLSENIKPIEEHGLLNFLKDDSFLDYGITFDHVFGHTEAMTIPSINYHGQKIIFAADLMPSSFHVPLPYVMSYDLRPLDTFNERKALYNKVLKEKAILFFEHDPIHQMATLIENDRGRVVIDNYITIENLSK